MKTYHKRMLAAVGGIICLGITLAALMSLGFSARSGALETTADIAPYRFNPGKGLYLLSFSGTVAEHFNGDMKVELTGTPGMDYRLVNLAPLRFFAQSQAEGLQDETLVGLKPGDKVALLVLMTPQLVKAKGFEVPIASCCVPPEALSSDPTQHNSQPLALNFVAAASGKQLLKLPVEFHIDK